MDIAEEEEDFEASDDILRLVNNDSLR